jgi:hypothetical protein
MYGIKNGGHDRTRPGLFRDALYIASDLIVWKYRKGWEYWDWDGARSSTE